MWSRWALRALARRCSDWSTGAAAACATACAPRGRLRERLWVCVAALGAAVGPASAVARLLNRQVLRAGPRPGLAAAWLGLPARLALDLQPPHPWRCSMARPTPRLVYHGVDAIQAQRTCRAGPPSTWAESAALREGRCGVSSTSAPAAGRPAGPSIQPPVSTNRMWPMAPLRPGHGIQPWPCRAELAALPRRHGSASSVPSAPYSWILTRWRPWRGGPSPLRRLVLIGPVGGRGSLHGCGGTAALATCTCWHQAVKRCRLPEGLDLGCCPAPDPLHPAMFPMKFLSSIWRRACPWLATAIDALQPFASLALAALHPRKALRHSHSPQPCGVKGRP